MPTKTSLAAKGISCQRGGRLLFEGLSFALEPGESLLVSGPNGAGKTSLLRLIAGLLPLQAGRIEGGDASVPLLELCHYVGHLNGIKSSLTLGENVRFWVDFLGGDGSELDSAYRKFGLEELRDLPAGILSAGQKRKLALLRLFAAPRPIWLLDEPSVSLDVVIGQSPRQGDRAASWRRRHRRGCEPRSPQGEVRARTRADAGERAVTSAWALFRRDVMLAWREGGTIGTALGFYLVVVAITPLGLGPDLNLLSRIAPGVLWVALLLASLLSADRIFHNDYEDGALDVLTTGPLPLELVAAAKSLAHWVTTGIPLALLAPVLGLLLNLPIESLSTARALHARRHACGELRRRHRR